MPITLAELYGPSKALAITFDNDPAKVLNVTYIADKLTPEMEGTLRAFSADNDAAKGPVLADLVYDLLSGWDLADMPFNRESMNKVPMTRLTQIVGAIFEDMAPNQTESETSGVG